MSWHCIPIIKGVACGAVAAAALAAVHPIAHFQAFVHQHPIPACGRVAEACHMVWTPDATGAIIPPTQGDTGSPANSGPGTGGSGMIPGDDDFSPSPYGFVPGSSYYPESPPPIVVTTPPPDQTITPPPNNIIQPPPPGCCTTTTPPPNTTVPEPSTLWLFAIASILCMGVKYRSRRV